MAWKTKLDVMYDEEEEQTVRGVKDGIDSRHGKHINKFCGLH